MMILRKLGMFAIDLLIAAILVVGVEVVYPPLQQNVIWNLTAAIGMFCLYTMLAYLVKGNTIGGYCTRLRLSHDQTTQAVQTGQVIFRTLGSLIVFVMPVLMLVAVFPGLRSVPDRISMTRLVVK